MTKLRSVKPRVLATLKSDRNDDAKRIVQFVMTEMLDERLPVQDRVELAERCGTLFAEVSAELDKFPRVPLEPDVNVEGLVCKRVEVKHGRGWTTIDVQRDNGTWSVAHVRPEHEAQVVAALSATYGEGNVRLMPAPAPRDVELDDDLEGEDGVGFEDEDEGDDEPVIAPAADASPDIGTPSLQRFFTIAFDIALMEQSILWNPAYGRIECGAWLAIVPECYRPQVLEILRDVAEMNLNRPFSQQQLRAFVSVLHDRIFRLVEPIHPSQINPTTIIE